MKSILAAIVVALAPTATLADSDGESANRVRASIYQTISANWASRLSVPKQVETRAEALPPSRRSPIPVRIRRGTQGAT